MNDSFVTLWHKLDDVVPDASSDIFFIVNGVIYPGKYDPKVEGFMMADGKGYGVEESSGDWMYIPPYRTPKALPIEGQQVVASINKYNRSTPFRGPVLGTFNEDRVGRYFIADDCYDIDYVADWKYDVEGWQEIPGMPNYDEKEPSIATTNLADVDDLGKLKVQEDVEYTPRETGMEEFPGEKPYLPKDGEEIDVKLQGNDFYKKGTYNAADNSFVFVDAETGEPLSTDWASVIEWEPSRIYK